MTIHPVTSDTDWDFFLEVHWRALGGSPEFEPEIGAWIRSLGNPRISALLRKSHRVQAWIMKRDCIPILRWITWSSTTNPGLLLLDTLSGIPDELTDRAWKEFSQWLQSFSQSHGFKKVESRTLLPWFETVGNTSDQFFEVKSDSPALLPFRTKIEKSRLLSQITFQPVDWNFIPEIYRPWEPLLTPLLDPELCFMAVQNGKKIGFILGGRHFSKPGEPHSQIFFRGKPTLPWRLTSKAIALFLGPKVKAAKIYWIAETRETEELGVSVILLCEFFKRAFEHGIKTVKSPLVSKDQLVLSMALKEIQAKPIKNSQHFSRQF